MLESFAEASVSDFERADLGPLSFQAAKADLDRLIQFVNEVVAQVDPELLPDLKLQAFRDTLFSLYNDFVSVKQFEPDPQSMEPFKARDAIVNKFRTRHDDLFTYFAPFVASASRPSAMLADARIQAQRATHTLIEFEKQKRTEIEELVRDLRDLATKAKEAAQETGVATHSGIFADVANHHEQLAKIWLSVLICLVLITVGAASWSLVWTFDNRTLLASFTAIPAAQFAIAKILIASLLFSSIVWSARMYRARRHNVVVNRHRQHALSTFETFVKATADQETKNAVLLQTTQSIFAPQPTGYMSEDSETAGTTKIVEIIRSFAESKK